MSKQQILIVEDEQKIAAVLRDYLEKSGYAAVVLNRGDAVMAQIKKRPPDLVLLDIMLPGMDGMDVCREIRKMGNIPVIMLTAKVEEIDRLIGLEMGADDYICKPFSPREVVARVKAVLRRARPEPETRNLVRGPIELHEETFRVTVNKRELTVTPSEFRLLQVLMANPGRVFSREELLARAQGYESDAYDRTIDSHVKNVRKKLARHLPGKEIIATVYGVGYKLTGFS